MLVRWLVAIMLTGSALAHAADGVVSIPSAHDVPGTEARLVAALEAKGMKVFARVDHAAGAASVNQALRPTRLVIFGNPAVGTILMQCAQTAALDLPQKALVWEDGGGRVWLSYNDPYYLAKRHGITGCDEALSKIQQALAGFARQAAAGENAADGQDEVYY